MRFIVLGLRRLFFFEGSGNEWSSCVEKVEIVCKERAGFRVDIRTVFRWRLFVVGLFACRLFLVIFIYGERREFRVVGGFFAEGGEGIIGFGSL